VKNSNGGGAYVPICERSAESMYGAIVIA